MNATYDDRNLQRLFNELDKPTRLKAVKTAFRREANKVKKTAQANLRGSGLHNAGKLGRRIRAVVFKRTAGFKVTVVGRNSKTGKLNTHDLAVMHTNRSGNTKPILVWAEEGTELRRTKTVTGKRTKFFRKRKGHSTGRMKRYGFMRKTLEQVRGKVTDELHNEVRNAVTEIAKKYGCM